MRLFARHFGMVALTISCFLAGCGGGSQPPQATGPITVSVSPASTTAIAPGSTVFTASVSGTANQQVTWSINGVAGGNSTVGTISSSGTYAAPALIPASPISITATSTADPSKSGSATVTLIYDKPVITSLTPNNVSIGSADTIVTINGSGFNKASQVIVNGANVPTVYSSASQLTATISAQKEILAGTLSVVVQNSSPGGGTSGNSPFNVIAGTISLNITGLPAGTPASLNVTGPNGFATSIPANQTLTNLPLGLYTITASRVNVSTTSYFPQIPNQAISLSSATPVSVTADYSIQTAITTKILDAVGAQTLAISQDGSTFSISKNSLVAQQLSPGDVLVSAPAAASPHGLLLRVSSVSQVADEIVLTGVPAQLSDVFSQATIDFSHVLTPDEISSFAPAMSGISINRIAPRQTNTTAAGVALPDSCAGNPLTEIAMVEVPIVEDPNDPSKFLKASGSIEFCPLFEFHYDRSFFHLKSVSVAVGLGEHSHLEITGQYSATVDITKTVLPPAGKTFVIFIGEIPVTITPQVSVQVGFSGTVTGGFSVNASEDASGKVGVSWDSGQIANINTFQLPAFALDPVQIEGTADAKAFVKIELRVLIYDIFAPHVGVSPFLSWNADITKDPWWTLTAGADGDVGIAVTLLGETFADPTYSAELFSKEIATSGGPFIPRVVKITSVAPSTPVSSSLPQTLIFSGTGFLNQPKVSLCFQDTCSEAVPTSSDASTINLSTVFSAGLWTAQVTNTDGSKSNVFSFTVVPPAAPLIKITSLNPSQPKVSQTDQPLTFIGSGFQQGLAVRLCLNNVCFPPLSGAQIPQIAVDGTSLQAVAKLGSAGQWTAQVINPDKTASTPFAFTVAGPFAIHVNPASGVVNTTQFLVSGEGASKGGTITAVSTWPDGSIHKFSALADNAGAFTFGPFTQSLTGTFTEIYTDATTQVQAAPLTYTVAAANSIPAIVSLNPATPTASSVAQSITLSGSGFAAGALVKFSTGTLTINLVPVAITPTQIQLSIALASAGTWTAQVVNPGGGASATFPFTVQPAGSTVVLSSITPSIPIASGANQPLVLNGNGFQPGLLIRLANGTSTFTLSGAQIVSVTSGQINTVAILSTAGSWTATVVNPNGSTSNPLQFIVNGPGTSPIISSISPSIPAPLPKDQDILVQGSGFQNGLTVTITFPGGSTTLSGTQIQSVTSTSFHLLVTLGIAGSYTLRINNPDGLQSNSFTFVAVPPQTITITSVNPAAPVRKDIDQTITVFGSGFQPGLTVTATIPGSSAQVILSGTKIQNVTPTSFQLIIALNVLGTYVIQIKNTDGSQSSPFQFQVVVPSAPQIASINPAVPTANASNQIVTVNGSGFQAGLTVSVTFPGGSSALSGTQIQNITATSFQMIILVGTTGNYTIRVNNPDGSISNVFSFSVSGPAISAVSPNPVTGSNSAQPFTILGSGFALGNTVTLRDKTQGQIFPNRTISSLSSTQIVLNPIFTTAAHTWSVEVLNSFGGSSGEFIFQVVTPPVQIASINPAVPTANASNQIVTVNGSGFQAGLTVSVTFPGGSSTLSGTQIQNITATSFQMIILVGTTGNYTIRVNNPDGSISNVFSFSVSGPAISAVSPNPVTGSNSAQPFTILGSGFALGNTVTLRDKTQGQIFPNRTISSLSSTQIVLNPIFTTAAHTWSVEVLNSFGGSSGEFIFQVK
jgi:hypothetical protein